MLIPILTISILVNLAYGQTNSKGVEIFLNEYKDGGNTKALIIGVSKYNNLSPDRQLNYADDDARLFYTYLIKRGVNKNNIKLLTDSFATAANVNSDLFKLLAYAKENDTIYIYFSGHGDVNNLRGNGYLLLYDVSPPTSGDYTSGGVLRMDDLKKDAENLKTKGCIIVMILDACRSGVITESNDEYSKQFLNHAKEDWSRSIKLISCQPGQSSYESIKWGNGHGAFSWFLVNGLCGGAEDPQIGYVRAKNLNAYIDQNLFLETNKLQSPSLVPDCEFSFGKVTSKLRELNVKQWDISPETIMMGKGNYTPFENIDEGTKLLLSRFLESIENRKLIPNKYFNNITEFLQIVNPSELREHKNKITAYKISENGEILISGDKSGKIIVWNIKGRVIKKRIDAFADISCIDIYKDSMFAVSSIDGSTKILSNIDYSIIQSFKFSQNNINKLAFDPEGKILVAYGDDNKIELYDIKQRKLHKPIKLYKNKVELLSFSRDSNYILAGLDNNSIKSWMLSDLKAGRIFNDQNTTIKGMYFDKNMNIIYSIDTDNQLLLYDIHFNRLTKKILKINSNEPINIKPNKEKKYLFLSSFGNFNIQIIDLESFKNIDFNKPSDYKRNFEVVFDDNNSTLISMEDNGNMRFYDLIFPKSYASELWDTLIQIKELKPYYNKLRSTFAVALQAEGVEIMAKIINDYTIDICVDSVRFAIDKIDYALQLYSNERDRFYDKMNFTKYFLETYISLSKRVQKNYASEIKKMQYIATNLPDASYPHNALAILFKRINDLYYSEVSSNKAIDNSPRWVAPQYELADTYIRTHRVDSAIDIYKKIIKLTPNNDLGYFYLSSLYTDLGRFREADSIIVSGFEKSESNVKLNLAAAKLYLSRFDYPTAQSYLFKSVVADSSYSATFKLIGDYATEYFERVDHKVNHLQIANNSYSNALYLDSLSPNNYVNLAVFYLKLFEYFGNDTCVFTNNFQKGLPYYKLNSLSNSKIAPDINMLFSAIDLCYEALELDSFYLPAYKVLGDIYIYFSDKKNTSFQNTLHSNSLSSFANVQDSFIESYFRKFCAPIISSEQANAFAFYQLRKGDTISAIKNFNHSLTIDRKNINTYINLLDLYHSIGYKKQYDSTLVVMTKNVINSPIPYFEYFRYENNSLNKSKIEESIKKNDSKFRGVKLHESIQNINSITQNHTLKDWRLADHKFKYQSALTEKNLISENEKHRISDGYYIIMDCPLGENDYQNYLYANQISNFYNKFFNLTSKIGYNNQNQQWYVIGANFDLKTKKTKIYDKIEQLTRKGITNCWLLKVDKNSYHYQSFIDSILSPDYRLNCSVGEYIVIYTTSEKNDAIGKLKYLSFKHKFDNLELLSDSLNNKFYLTIKIDNLGKALNNNHIDSLIIKLSGEEKFKKIWVLNANCDQGDYSLFEPKTKNYSKEVLVSFPNSELLIPGYYLVVGTFVDLESNSAKAIQQTLQNKKIPYYIFSNFNNEGKKLYFVYTHRCSNLKLCKKRKYELNYLGIKDSWIMCY